ncbi:FAD-dependent oxidoreductase, partial [Candidatus Thorarchaeota archaeon]
GKRSTKERIARSPIKPTLLSASPGDLSFVLPYRHLSSILEMLDGLDKLCPGVADDGTLLYGVEVKFYSSRLQLNQNLETEVSNLYAAGDGAGITRGLMQASVSGVLIARDILRKENVSLA